jgi:uncharacterized protein
MYELSIANTVLTLLPEKAIYVDSIQSLLVSDVHLGKSETFQALGVPVPPQVNQATLARLRSLCQTYQPQHLFILGDLFHSRLALVEEVRTAWADFSQSISAQVHLLVGNHDRPLIQMLEKLLIQCITEAIQIDQLVLSHEPFITDIEANPIYLNICGHIHPCIQLKTKLDRLRLPCFYFNQREHRLILPSFGEFTGGYDMPLSKDAVAYAIADNQVIPITK